MGKSNSSRNPRKARAEQHKAERDPTAPVPGRLDFKLAMDDCGKTGSGPDEGGEKVHGWENRGAAINNYRASPNEFLRDLYSWQENTDHARYSYYYRTYVNKFYIFGCPHCKEASGRWCPVHVRQVILLQWREVVKEMTRGWTRPLEMQDYGDIFASALKQFQRSPNKLGAILGHE